MTEIYILGGAQTDFARNYMRSNKEIFDMFAEVVEDGLAATGLEPSEIEVGHVGNFVADLFTGQGQIGGFFGHVHPDFIGMPSGRHEAACASGSIAALSAMADIEAGRYGLACVVGLEYMRNVPGDKAAEYLGAAAWIGHEGAGVRYLWPSMFSRIAEEYNSRYGLKREHLRRISEINFANAKNNPLAQTRGWNFTDDSFGEDNTANPVIEGWMRKSDCGQVTDGAAVVFLANREVAEAYAKKRNLALEDLPRIKGWGHTSAQLQLEDKFRYGEPGGYMFPTIRKAITDAYRRAGISSPDQLDAIELHDCFSMTEYMLIEHFGLANPGEAWKVIEAGDIAMGGRIPINPSGGLIGLGHPVGATGVRILLDAYRQVTGTAGDYQVEGAKNIGTFNVGGSGTTSVSFVVGRD
ncbi:acetyl-CoA acetyltransferase [Govanella unica]|uniref:Acetyl-CoA acetyltransferase n=1 Tax=Govanella unica TaxID=2975056 RepID=A0A9X3TXE3_9PROT|nr:acetyl-CoA acetyltransferase [Govania unica]MDA5193513.1 acetyl-CoA acetyltransferase [Govania unica]